MEAVLFTRQDQERIARIEKDIRALKQRELPEVIISQGEAARYIGISYTTLNRYIKTGRLRIRTLGGVRGILLADLVKFKSNE